MTVNVVTNGQDEKPWWRYGYVWLVLAGPIVVIIASAITVVLALQDADPVEEDYYRKGVEINKRLEAKEMLPAVDGRNHVVTPVNDGDAGTASPR